MKITDRTRNRLRREERGAAAVEFAIVASLFFMLVFGIIDFGFAFHSWNNAVNAAREGARTAAVDPNVTDITNRVRTAASTLDQSKLTISVLCSRGGAGFSACPAGSTWLEGDIVRVVVNYQYDMITPVGSFVPGLGQTLTLHSQSESRFEGQ
ncbi:MAG: TadE/TadG family type IV pilus assembly protein [Actinomycetota bacterium]